MKFFNFSLRIAFIIIALLICHPDSFGQKGYPFISPYSFERSIDNDNYDLIQDNNHSLLIANRKGILSFDSRKWDLLPMPYFPVTIVKSRYDGTIYTGCRNGFGIVELDVTGKYVYRLLSDTLFTGEINTIQVIPDRDFFISRNTIYSTGNDHKNIKKWNFPYEFKVSGSFVFRDEFYFMIYNKGLYKAQDDTFKSVLTDRLSTRTEIVFATETDSKEILIGNNENELFLFNGLSFSPVNIKDSEYLKASIITDGVYLGGEKIAIASMLGGVIIIDYKTGLTSSIINYKSGLPDDEIFCLGTDNDGGLWVCHSYGVSRIDNNLSVSNFTWYPGLNGNLTNSLWFNGQLYVGTSDGLYVLQEKREYSEKFIPVVNSKVVLTDESPVAEQNTEVPVLTSGITAQESPPATVEPPAKKGIFKKLKEAITGEKKDSPVIQPQHPVILNKISKKAEKQDILKERKSVINEVSRKKVYSLQSISHSYQKIPAVTGKCTEILAVKDHLLVATNNGLFDIRKNLVIPVLPNTYISFITSAPANNLLFAGTENSFFILSLDENRWEVIREFDALDYPVYSACMTSPDELWLGSDNSVHRISLDSDYYIEGDETYAIPTKFSDKVILRNFNNEIHFFLSSGIYRMVNNEIQAIKTFDDLSSLPLYFFSGNNIAWYYSAGRWGNFSENSSVISNPEKYLNIFQSIQDISLGTGGNLWIIANNQEVFKIQENTDQISSDGFSLFFSSLKGKNDFLFPLQQPKITYNKSSLRIEFSAPYYIAPEKTEFAFRIEGKNDEWSDWSTVSTLDYPLLPPGKYNIAAKARNIFSKESAVTRLQIYIKPPFWRTSAFFILLTLLVFTLFVFFVRFREKNLKKAKNYLEQKVRERTVEIEKQKNEIAEQKKEITDSIHYAKRIQSAVLPSTKMLSSVLSDYFILFQP